MKNKIIALLLGIMIGLGYFIGYSFYYKGKITEENKKIQNQIIENNYLKNQFLIKTIKEKTIKDIKNVDTNIEKNANIKITIYSYNNIYKYIYDRITKAGNVSERLGHKNFEDTLLYKRLSELRENVTFTEILNNDTKKVQIYNYIPVDIDCSVNVFCKKVIIKDINEIYNSNKKILEIKNIDTKSLLLNDDKIIKFIKGTDNFYDFFTKNKK